MTVHRETTRRRCDQPGDVVRDPTSRSDPFGSLCRCARRVRSRADRSLRHPLRIAERGLYRPLWSDRILAEAADAVVDTRTAGHGGTRGGRRPFAKAAALLGDHAGLKVTAKRVERSAEADGEASRPTSPPEATPSR